MFARGIDYFMDIGNLLTPSSSLPVLQFHNFPAAPMKIIRNKRNFLKYFLLRIQPYPSCVKFSGVSNTSPQAGHTDCITGVSISLILWYISCRKARSAV